MSLECEEALLAVTAPSVSVPCHIRVLQGTMGPTDAQFNIDWLDGNQDVNQTFPNLPTGQLIQSRPVSIEVIQHSGPLTLIYTACYNINI